MNSGLIHTLLNDRPWYQACGYRTHQLLNPVDYAIWSVIQLNAAGNILTVHYKDIKCDVSFSIGSVSTLFRWGGHFCHICVKWFLLFTVFQKLYKSIKIFQSYDHKCTATFLWFTVYNNSTCNYRILYVFLADIEIVVVVVAVVVVTPDNVYGAVIWHKSRVHPVHLMNVEQRQAAADPQIKPIDLGVSRPVRCYCLHPLSPFSLLLLSPKADTHLTGPRRVEGWVELGTQGVRNLLKFFLRRLGVERNASPTLYQLSQHATPPSSWIHYYLSDLTSECYQMEDNRRISWC